MTMNSKGQMRPEGQQHISPAIAQHAANECERLRGIIAELIAALERVIAGELCRFDPLNPCWNGRPMDVAGKHWGVGDACSVCNARAALDKAQEGKS